MLVLTRKAKEGINIFVNGQLIRVTVEDIRGNRIRLGFDAPADVKILRDEVAPAIPSGAAA